MKYTLYKVNIYPDILYRIQNQKIDPRATTVGLEVTDRPRNLDGRLPWERKF